MAFDMCARCKKKENEKEGIWLTHLNYCYKLFKIKPFYFGF